MLVNILKCSKTAESQTRKNVDVTIPGKQSSHASPVEEVMKLLSAENDESAEELHSENP